MNKINLSGVSDDDNRTLNHLLEHLDQKSQRNKLRSAYYEMRKVQRLIGSVIPPQYFNLGIVLGWTGKAVDTLNRRCNLDGFVWPDGTLADIGYDEVWEGNNLGSEVSQGTVSSLIHSTSFVINTLGDESDSTPGMIHFKDALNATGDWNSRRRRLDNLLSITQRDHDGEPIGLALYLDGRTITATKESGSWTADEQPHSYGVPAEPLPYKPRLGRPFGSSRISRAVMSLQDGATRTVIRMEAHSDIYAIPDLWVMGASESLFKNKDGSIKDALQVLMGRLKLVPNDPDEREASLARPDVRQIPAASPQPHLDAFKQQAQMFSGETSIPLTSLGVSDMSNPTSADSYIASREDLISESEGATDDWRPGLRRAFIRALAMQNNIGIDSIPDEWKTIDTKWRSPIYLSRAQQADAGAKTIGAVPWLAETEVGLEQLGLDAQQIKRALAEKKRLDGRGVLKQLQQAAQQVTGPQQVPPDVTDDGNPSGA